MSPNLFGQSGINIINHRTNKTVLCLKSIIIDNFNIFDDYLDWSEKKYRNKVLNVQNKINQFNFSQIISCEIKESIAEFLGEEDFLVQSNVYLRASRPKSGKSLEEAIDWHRESFYGPNVESAANVWTPVYNVNERNTLQFIPRSQLIDSSKIVLNQFEHPTVWRGSSSHRIGYLYSPKKILSGIDFSSAEKMIVPEYSSSIFPAELIHGAAVNHSNFVRYSVDFRVIAKSKHNKKLNKNKNFNSKNPYFIPFQP